MCFQKDGKTAQAARFIKSRIMTNLIDYVLSIDKFEQRCVFLKDMLQSPQLKYHAQTIGIDQSLSKNTNCEHKCLENIKNVYKQAGKCEDQQQFKDILKTDIVSTPEGFNNYSLISPMKSTPVEKPRALFRCEKKLIPVDLELLKISARQLNMELYHRH